MTESNNNDKLYIHIHTPEEEEEERLFQLEMKESMERVVQELREEGFTVGAESEQAIQEGMQKTMNSIVRELYPGKKSK